MAQGDVNIIINADASKMESEVKRARDELGRFARAVAETEDTSAELNRAMAEAQTKFDKAADAARKAGVDIAKYEDRADHAARSTADLGEQLGHLDKGTRVLNGAMGDIVGPLNDFSELAAAAGPRTAAVGVAALAAVAAIGALAGQVFGVITNIQDYTEAIDRAAHTNMVTQGQVDALYQANAGVTLSQRVWDTFIATAAAKFAPRWNQFMTGLVGSITYFGELADQVLSGNVFGAHSKALEVAAGTVQGYLRQRKELAEQTEAEAHATTKASDAHAAQAPRIADVTKQYRGLTQAIQHTTKAATETAKAVDTMPTIEFGEIGEIEFAETEAEAAARKAAEFMAGIEGQMQEADLGGSLNEAFMAVGETIDELPIKLEKFKASAAGVADVFSKVGAGVGAVGDIFSGALELADGASRQVKMRLFTAMKAARVSEAIINGAVAITRAFAELGPVGGAIMAPIVAAQTGVQIGLIAKQRPTFHRGGYLASPSMLSPDEVVIRRNEVPAMMTAQGARALGQSGLARMNAGEAPATGGGVFVMLDGRRVGTRLFAAPDPTYGMRLAGVY
jgi:hypothetical protein